MKNLHTQVGFFYYTENWKNYWVNGLKKFIRGNVMDVGTGSGSNLPFYLKLKKINKLICLEPDKKLFKKLKQSLKKKNLNKVSLINKQLAKLNMK